MPIRLSSSHKGAEVGGPTPGVTGDEDAKKQLMRKDADEEPVAFHGDSPLQIQEDIHTCKLKGAIELTTLDETLCMQCLEVRKPWLGICYSEEHARLLKARVIQCLWNKFSDEKSNHYKPALAAILYKSGLAEKPAKIDRKADPKKAIKTRRHSRESSQKTEENEGEEPPPAKRAKKRQQTKKD